MPPNRSPLNSLSNGAVDLCPKSTATSLSAAPLDRQVFAWFRTSHRFSVHSDLHVFGPPGNSEVEREFGSFGGRNADFHAAVPRIICFLSDFEARAVFKVPVEIGIIVKMQVDSIIAGAVEISWERGERALQVRGATGRVVPRVANFLAR